MIGGKYFCCRLTRAPLSRSLDAGIYSCSVPYIAINSWLASSNTSSRFHVHRNFVQTVRPKRVAPYLSKLKRVLLEMEDTTKLCKCSFSSDDEYTQLYEFESEGRVHTIRNIKFSDYIFYTVPGSSAWKKLRRLPYAVIALMGVAGPTFTLTALLVELNTAEQFIFEVTSAVVGFVVGLGDFGTTNVDIFLLRVRKPLFVFDFVTVVATIILLLVFGEGFALFGASYVLTVFVHTYCFEGHELNVRLNTGDPNHLAWFKLKVLFICAMLLPVGIFRISVFFKKVTVSNGVTIGELAGEEISLRDLWEFFLDVIVVRLLVLGVEKLQSDRLALVPAYVTIRRLERMEQGQAIH